MQNVVVAIAVARPPGFHAGWVIPVLALSLLLLLGGGAACRPSSASRRADAGTDKVRSTDLRADARADLVRAAVTQLNEPIQVTDELDRAMVERYAAVARVAGVPEDEIERASVSGLVAGALKYVGDPASHHALRSWAMSEGARPSHRLKALRALARRDGDRRVYGADDVPALA